MFYLKKIAMNHPYIRDFRGIKVFFSLTINWNKRRAKWLLIKSYILGKFRVV